MGEKLVCPGRKVHWYVEADSHPYASAVFHSIVCSESLSVLLSLEMEATDQRLRYDSLGGEMVFWSECSVSNQLIVRYNKDVVVMVTELFGSVGFDVSAKDLETARRVATDLRKLFPSIPVSEEPILPITFWHCGSSGPASISRKIELICWSGIAANYSVQTRAHLATLVEGFKPAKNSGRLLLWHGEPGTGKTFAIRALAWAWKEWCNFEYVIDPEQLFDNGNYLTEVLMRTDEANHKDQKWKLLILEDTGEMMGVDAKRLLGQGLSRLLNVSDGILGQGTRTMILVTTNEDLAKLNPAITRPGRCLSRIDFRRFSSEEANRWLRNNGSERHTEGSRTLSELYSVLSDGTCEASSSKIGFRSLNDRESDAIKPLSNGSELSSPE